VQVSLSTDGRRLASASWDGTTKIWDVERVLREGQPIELATLITLDDRDEWLVTTPGGYYDCSLEAASFVVWRLGEHLYPFDQFEAKFHRPDLVRKALAGEDISDARPLDGTQIPPNVTFASPKYGAEVTGDTVDALIETAGVYPIKRVDLSVNGRPLAAEVASALDLPQPNEKEHTFRVTVPLPPGESQVRLRAVAYDTELLRSRPAELFLRRAGVKPQPGRLLVVAIGLSQYENPAWNTLQYADDDAIALAEEFAKHHSRGYSSVEKRVLTDQQATVSNV